MTTVRVIPPVQRPDTAASFFAAIYDPFLALGERRGMRALRRRVLTQAGGRTLELGAGTGLNLGAYPAGVAPTLTEPDLAMLRRLRRRAGSDAEIVRASAEDLPFPDASFDTVVSTLVLCTVDDVSSTLREIRRVLAPGGRLLVIEHVRSAKRRRARWQDRVHRPWKAFAQGCRCNRDTTAALAAAGFDVSALQATTWRGMPSFVRPLIAGPVF